MTKTIEDLFLSIAVYSALITVLLFIFLSVKGYFERIFLFLFLYSAIEFVIFLCFDLLGIIPARYQGTVYSIFTFVEYSLFALILSTLIVNPKLKILIRASILLFGIFCTLYFVFASYKFIDSIPIGVETILVLSFCFYYLYEQLENINGDLIYHRYSFWLVSGILIYLAGSFFIYVFANQVDRATLLEYWIFTNIFSTFKNLLFGISMLIYFKQKTATPKKKLYHSFN